jgi:hypothetical protein
MPCASDSRMSRARVRLAVVILGIIVLGHTIDIVLQREDWPFSNYPMYAKLIRKKETSLLRLYGRVTDGKAVWVMPIVDDNLVMYVPPVNELRMKNILDYAWSHGEVKATQKVLRDYMAMYEERRIIGTQGTALAGPRMLEAICMRMTWKLDVHGGEAGEPILEELTSASAFPAPPPLDATTRPADVSEAAP